jgi:hypothetical protein
MHPPTLDPFLLIKNKGRPRFRGELAQIHQNSKLRDFKVYWKSFSPFWVIWFWCYANELNVEHRAEGHFSDLYTVAYAEAKAKFDSLVVCDLQFFQPFPT